jgi:hypothetical protein
MMAHRALLTWLSLSIAYAAVEGTVVNRTTGKPQPGAVITLYGLGAGPGGMKPVQTVKSDTAGKFTIAHEVSGPHLLQTIHSGVLYNEMLEPGSATTGLELPVYESTSKATSAKVSQHMVILEPLGTILHVNETVMFRNDGDTTYNDPANGTLRVFLPEGIRGKPRVMVTAPQGMPIERSAAETKTPRVYKIDFPVKPGETRFDLTYVFPMPDPPAFESQVLHNGANVRLVAPQGVTLSGGDIRLLGQEPKTQAKVYEVQGRDYTVQIEGTGQLAKPEAGESDGGSGERGIQTISARIYDQAYVILGLSLLILLLGFILLYRRGAGSAPGDSRPEAKGR